LLLAKKEKVNELLSKLESLYKFSKALKVMKKLGAEPNANDKYPPCFVIIDESVGNTLGGLSAGFNKVSCDNKKLSSYVVLEDSGYDLGEDGKWSAVAASSRKRYIV